MSLEAVRLRNLRCLADTTSVPIKPLTVLLGRNSSGKSSFLRAFPLLRQSVETSRSSPILWYLPGYVDFGTFHDAVDERATTRSISFEFVLRLPKEANIAIDEPSFPFRVAMMLSNGGTSRAAYMSAYEIDAEGHEVRLDFDATGRATRFSVNDQDMLPTEGLALGGIASLLPPLEAPPRVLGASMVTYRPAQLLGYQKGADILLRDLGHELKELFLVDLSSLLAKATNIRLGARPAMVECLKELLAKYAHQRSEVELTEARAVRIVDRAVARWVPYIIEASDQVLADLMSRVAYVAPKRAAAERAYRLQDLAVNDVDPRGDNLAMFLHSLSSEEWESFRRFTTSWLGFSPGLHVEGIHAGLLVTEADETQARNIVDVGFGYSEVLPVATAVWSSCVRKPRAGARSSYLLAIEQPELHLHPAFQAKLARMFVGAIKQSRERGQETKILVETHSEALVSGLGQLVYEGMIDARDVQLVVFERDPGTRGSRIKLAEYDEQGALRNWPYGFFLSTDA